MTVSTTPTIMPSGILPTVELIATTTNAPESSGVTATPSATSQFQDPGPAETGTPTAVLSTPAAPRFRLITSTPDAVRDATQTALFQPPPANVEVAQQELQDRGIHFTLLVISAESEGVQGAIYRDLLKRHLRATSGPDEGFDTRSLDCFPKCVLVRAEVVNEISVESWVNVLRHEQRHMVQAANNPNLALQFRPTTDALFTTYAAFMEACADDGIFVAENIYHSSERMPELRAVLGLENVGLMEPACAGFRESYESIVTAFDAKQGEGAFAALFPPYK